MNLLLKRASGALQLNDMAKQYYYFYLEMSLKDKKDRNIYAQVNISHIPSVKLIEILNIDIKKDPHLSAGYC